MKQNDEKGRAADDAGYHKDHEGAGTDAGAVSDRQRGEQLPPYPGQRRLPGRGQLVLRLAEQPGRAGTGAPLSGPGGRLRGQLPVVPGMELHRGLVPHGRAGGLCAGGLLGGAHLADPEKLRLRLAG